MRSPFKLRRTMTVLAAVFLLVALMIPGVNAKQPSRDLAAPRQPGKPLPDQSGIREYTSNGTADAKASPLGANLGTTARVETNGINITECPQAGLEDTHPQPLDTRVKDQVEQLSDNGDDIRTNQDYSCFPQNETSIAVNPRHPRNIVGGANDYRLGGGLSGFYASTDGGRSWYDGDLPFPSLPNGDIIDSSGDPAVAFDRDGVVYYAEIAFSRTDDSGGIFVLRSTNGGFTWSRPCVPNDLGDPDDDVAVCGGLGDVRQPGDGLITFLVDDNDVTDASIDFNDKEYITTGPRPEGVDPVCFGPETRTPVECDPAVIGSDRIYVTWTIFGSVTNTNGNRIYISYSDDQARSWSPPQSISGSAPFCVGFFGADPNACDANQGSVPTVNPHTGHLYVAWLNGNTIDEDQYVVVRSDDGGQTFEGPFFITPVFDLNYPRPVNGRTECVPRGQGSTRQVLTNSCFRVNSFANIVVDKRGGAFADDLYVVVDDNRNGTIRSSNVDVFLFKSLDGGETWIGPTRVNDDQSTAPDDRDCGRDPFTITGDASLCPEAAYGNDQWFPWVDINERGHLNVVFHDRRLDTNSDPEQREWPTNFSRPGNYLAWFWGAQCVVRESNSTDCVAEEAEVITQPTEPIDPGADPVPGQGQQDFPFRNFAISDVPSNMDYSFRAGIFMGDYNNVAVWGNKAYGFWTDTRNGRSSLDQPGRNPICEQSDVYLDIYDSRNASSDSSARRTDRLFWSTPCPGARE